MGVITLLTDFGLTDEYVGVMKGVILGINPEARIVDLTHHVPAQNVQAASFILNASYPYFPKGTIHVAVVDPGVGSDRKILAAKADGRYFLAPDNGLLTPILENASAPAIYSVTNHDLFLPAVSSTFHGRDIFSPVAAHLSSGISLEDLGDQLSIQDLHPAAPLEEKLEEDRILGQVVWVDHFGNLLTTINTDALERLAGGKSQDELLVRIGDEEIPGIVSNYSEASPGDVVALVGSRGYLEISVCMGDARDRLQAGPGTAIVVTGFRPEPS